MLWHVIFVTLDGSSRTEERTALYPREIVVPLPSPAAVWRHDSPIPSYPYPGIRTRTFRMEYEMQFSRTHGVAVYREVEL